MNERGERRSRATLVQSARAIGPSQPTSATSAGNDDMERCTVSLPPDLLGHLRSALAAKVDYELADAARIARMATLARSATGCRIDGDNALRLCARACAISRQVMQEYATVGARWNAAQLDALLAVRDADGKPLGMARLVLIARAPAALRDDLLRLAARDALDVRQLRAHRRHRVQSALCAGPSGIVNPTTKN